MRHLEEKVIKVVCMATVIIILLALILLLYFSLPDAYGPKPWIRVYFSVDSHEDVWLITIDRIYYYDGEEEKFLSSISSERVQLNFDLKNSLENYSWVYMPLPNIKDRWSEVYTYTHHDIETGNKSTANAKMNRIIWHDNKVDEKLSVDDTIIIEKEGGKDWQILPEDIIYFTGHERGTCYSEELKLPNFTENQMYDPGEMEEYDRYSEGMVKATANIIITQARISVLS